MTFDQLVAFLAVAAEGGFVAAAERLHKSQPAVSKLVRNLEAELGLELFDRSQYRATLSEKGQRFRERALGVIEGVHELESFGRELAANEESVVRLAVDAVTPLRPVLDVLRTLRERHPLVRIELRTERLAGTAAALDEEAADLVVATPLGVDRSSVEAAAFARVRVIAVAGRDHPLATHRGPIPPVTLRRHPQIVLKDSARDAAAPSVNVLEGGLRWSVTDVAAKREILLQGMGWGGLPEPLIADDLAAGRLVPLDVPSFDVGTMELFLFRRRDRAHGVVAGELWRELVELSRAASARG